MDRPVEVVRVGCEDISLDKCITVPDIVTEVETSEVRREDVFSTADLSSVLQVCRTELGAPDCKTEELELPKESCIEIVYGYAHGFEKRL